MITIFKAKRPFRLTRAGWVFILYTIGVGAGAINTGNNLLYLIFGVFLGLILASGVLSDLSLWGVSADCVYPESCHAGQSIFIPCVVKNDKPFLPSISVSVELAGSLKKDPVSLMLHVPIIQKKNSISSQFQFTPPRRGWFQMESMKFHTRYPFGLLRKWWTTRSTAASGAAGFFVFPELIEIKSGSLKTGGSQDRSQNTSEKKGEDVTIFGLREFRHSDNPKKIHWKASAKRGSSEEKGTPSWYVREMDGEEKDEVALVWPEVSWVQDAQETEKLISFAASIALELQKKGETVRFFLPVHKGKTVEYFEVPADEDENALFKFLAVFDPASPANELSSAFLKPAGSVKDLKIPRIDLLEKFRAENRS